MAVDVALRYLAKSIESGQSWPRPRCPACGSGHIRFGMPEESEGYASASERDHPAFEPDWIKGTFLIRGQCENPNCAQVVHGTGDYRVDDACESVPFDPHNQLGRPYSSYYRVVHLHPAMLLMSIPESAPTEVREGVLRASRVMFADPGMAATALRATVERLLTFEGVPSIDASGRFCSAHRRIETWQDANASRIPVAELLFAVKWLGNAGTHEDSSLSVLDVLDGASLLDEAFHRIYAGPDIDARAQSINTARGPSRSASRN